MVKDIAITEGEIGDVAMILDSKGKCDRGAYRHPLKKLTDGPIQHNCIKRSLHYAFQYFPSLKITKQLWGLTL